MLSVIFLLMNFCNAIMVSKKLKDKQLASNPDRQMIKHEPTSKHASPVEITNMFTILGTIAKPNYSFVLANSYDPYAVFTANHPV